MKRVSDIRGKIQKLQDEQEIAFISQGRASQADRVPRENRRQRRITGAGKMPAEGFQRTSMDLPKSLYRRLKVAAAQEGRTLQSIAVEAFTAWLKKSDG